VVVVVDDGSSDGTAALAGAAGARVVTAPPRPAGWNGKPWACHVGAGATSAPVLCFLDADVVLAPDALARTTGELDRRGGLVSVQPWHRTGSAVEGLSLLPNLVSMMAVDAFGPLRGRLAPTGAFGPVLATTRAAYGRAGGHAGVRGALMEDVALARRYRDAGLPVTCFAGRGVASFRMHRGGLGDVARGWVRSLGDGARRVRPLTLVAVVVWLSGLASAPLVAAVGPRPVGLALWAAYAAQLLVLGRRVGRFPAWSWALLPLSVIGFVVLFLRSVGAAALGRQVPWKGRKVGRLEG
jgi:4,4'-diaponeurosporenoate glycosyltransferase